MGSQPLENRMAGIKFANFVELEPFTANTKRISMLNQMQAVEYSTMDERNDLVSEINIADNGGRRKNNDRRQFSYTFHIPERRSGIDRRAGEDRRKDNRHSD